MTDLGRLERVDIREVWEREDRDFTPWLAENLDRLSEVIGIPLEREGIEVPVEQFSADILARNTNDGSMVLIENQLESTDHMHLGQILTYLAGLEAKTVIWIAAGFEAAHLSAIRWLNEHTVDSVVFLAVRIRLVKIGDSQPAPVFELIDAIERPTKWDRRKEDIAWRSGLSEDQRSRLGFWSYYVKEYPDDGVSNGHHRTEARCGVESWDVDIVLCLWKGEVAISYRPSEENTDAESLLARLGEREDEMREKLEVNLRNQWETYWFYKVLRVNPYDQEKWPELADWLHLQLGKYRGALTE